MAFAFNATHGNYNDRRYDVIRNLEESGGVPSLTAYKDSKGYATIGAGFKVDSWTKEILKNMNLSGVGPDDQTTTFKKVATAIATATKGTFSTNEAAQTAINDALNTALGLQDTQRISFAYSSNGQVKATFSDIAIPFEAKVNNWFGAANGTIPESRERLALLSLAYNNVLGKSPSLRQALIDGDRAKAWFEIRYRSNGDISDGIAKRRYYESALFGLFTNPSAPTIEEAFSAFRMLSPNRQAIIDYEKKYGEWQDASGTYMGTKYNNVATATNDYSAVLADLPLGQVPTAVQAFNPAKNALLSELTTRYIDLKITADKYLSTAIFVAKDEGGKFDSTLKNSTGKEIASNDILVGVKSADTFVAGAGDDYLIGGAGNDRLEGGTDSDTYVFKSGEGKDTINDSDGVGRVIVGGKELTGAANNKYSLDGNKQIWESADGTVTYIYDRNTKALTLKGSALGDGQIIIDHFDTTQSNESGYLGLKLERKSLIELATSGGSNPFGDVGHQSQKNLSNLAEGLGKGINCFLNAPAKLGDIIKLSLTGGDVGMFSCVTGDDVISFLAGEITLELTEGQTEIAFALLSTGDVDADQSLTLSATLNSADGSSGVVNSLGINFDANDASETSPVTTNVITAQFFLYVDTEANDLIQTDTGSNYYGSLYSRYYDNVIVAPQGGDDRIETGIGNDDIKAGPGNDWALGQSGRDNLYGEAGDDHLFGEEETTVAQAIVDGNRQSGSITQGDQLDGGEGNDTLIAGVTSDNLKGGSGNDVLVGGAGGDWLEGDNYSDGTIDDGLGADLIYAGNGRDIVIAGGGDDLVYGDAGDDYLQGESGNDVLLGGTGNDYIFGDSGSLSSTLTGLGNDFLDGGEGDDLLEGGGGNDALYGGTGNDKLFGDLPADAYAANANSGDDYLDGEDGNDVLTGGLGADTLFGGTGADRLFGDDLNMPLEAQGDDSLDGGADDDMLDGGGGSDTLIGGAGNDTLYGDSSNTPDSAMGNDMLDGGDGDDILVGAGGADTLIGGLGNDIMDGDSSEIAAVLFGDDVLDGGDGDDELTGNGGNDRLEGGDGNDMLYGDTRELSTSLVGNDTLIGGAGNDNLDGGYGNDTLEGGEGDDTFAIDAGSGIKHITGGNGNDTLLIRGATFASASFEQGRLLLASETLGSEIYLDDVGTSSSESGSGIELFQFDDGTYTYQELLAKENKLSGTSGDDTINGGDGNDVIDGGAGADWMSGGNGNDRFLVDASGDIVVEASDGGTDEVDASIDYALTENIENLVLTGLAVSGTGNSLDNTLTGNAANNVLDGGQGSDTLIGSAGDDTYMVDNVGDIVFEDTISGMDTVQSSVTFILASNLENLTLTGTTAINGTGNTSDNIIIGNAADNILTGGGGTDTLVGEAGNDTYRFGRDSGQTAINDNDATVGNLDTVEFSDDVRAADIKVSADNSNLYLTINDTSEQLTVLNYFSADDHKIEQVKFADGTVWNGNDLRQLFNSTPTGSVSIRGTATQNQMLTASHTLADVDGLGTIAYQWQTSTDGSNWSAIAGAAASRLVLSEAQVGKHIRVNASYTDGHGTLESKASSATNAIANVNDTPTGNVTVTGTATQNQVLTATNTLADVDGLGTVSYQWQSSTDGSNWSAITGATASSLTLSEAQVGKQVRVNASYTDDHGTLESNASNATTAIANVNDALSGNVTVTGTMTQNQTLTATHTLADADGLGTVTYQWQSSTNGTTWNAISGATAISFKLTEAQVGKQVRVNASYTDGHGTLESKASSATTAIANINDTPTGSVTLSGLAYQDQTLTASHTLADADGLGAITYQWQSSTDGKTWNPISGATGTSLTLSSTLTGKQVQAVARYTDGHGTVESMASASALVINRVLGTAAANVLTGTTGADQLEGLAGNDTYTVNHAGDVVIETSTLASEIDTVQASISYTLGNNLEKLTLTGPTAINGTGNSLNNTLTGNSAANLLDGGSGADSLIGGLGNDTYVVDNVGDTISETSTLASEIDTVQSSVSYTLSKNLEKLTLTGTTSINATGNNLSNTLTGNSAANILNGGTGADTLIGGLGNDTYVVDNVSDTISETSTLASEIDTVQSSVTYTLSNNVENLTLTGSTAINGTGNSLNNTLTGNSTANILDGGSGADSLVGGLGNDTYVVDNAGDTISETSTLTSEIDTVQSSISYTLGNNLEKLTLTGSTAINGAGNSLNNTLTGNSAANFLDGGSGADSLIGGLGNDTYIVDNAGDTISETSTLASEIDTVQASVTYTLSNNLENLTLTGSTAINATGNALKNTLTGNSAANTLNGGTGADTLIGGLGNDTYVVDNVGDTISETSTLASEIDTVQSSVSYTLSNNLENLTLTGSTAINATGNSLNNTLTGNSAANILNGGTGADTLIGGLGKDTYVVDNAGDTISETSTLASEIDTVQSSLTYTLGNNLENLTLTGTAALIATGNSLKNTLTGNSAANVLDGGAGTDTMIGGLGDDTYIVDVATDVVTENLNQGFDTVYSAVTLTLAANAEALFLSGSSAINGTGNALNNLIRGNTAINTLNGGAGNDLLEGGAGNDILTDTAGAALFNGGAGNDTLTGGAGAEIFLGGLGNDTLTTAAGNDLILFNKGDGQDTVAAGGTGKDTLSLGGGIAYADLALSKASNDLVLKVGAAESITFKNWYATTPSKPVANLQVIAEAMAGFVAGGIDPLKNQKVENFNFTGLVDSFDAARVANTGLTSWALSDALTKFQLAGSDSAALGGDIAYQYGKNGNLAAIGVTSALETISASSLGTSAQTLNSAATLQSSSIRLS
jgi:Ca2+-binding RTX toxin-like protein